jgi:hypothetical protein
MHGLRFPELIYQDDAFYDGIAIDIGGPGFQFNDDELGIEDRNAIITFCRCEPATPARRNLSPGGLWRRWTRDSTSLR